jgi:hypothetical protein
MPYRGTLNRKTVAQLRIVATALGLPTTYRNGRYSTYLQKTVLIDRILDQIEREPNLREDWLERAENHLSIYRIDFDPARNYTISDLNNFMHDLGIPFRRGTKDELKRLIQEKLQHEEEKVDVPTEYEDFHPHFEYNERFRKITATAIDLPFNVYEDKHKIITDFINWIYEQRRQNIHGHLQADEELHMTIDGLASVNSYYRGTHTLVENRIVPMHAMGRTLEDTSRVNRTRIVNRWLNDAYDYYQNLTARSDEYCEIENVSQLTISFKVISKSGAGIVTLKKPECFPNIFSPLVFVGDCFFFILFFLNLLEESILHTIKNEHNIGSSLRIKQISKVLPYLKEPVQFIIHPVDKNGRFPKATNQTTRIPNVAPQCTYKKIHIGYVARHFFLIQDIADLDRLSLEDFDIPESTERNFLDELRTINPVKTRIIDKGKIEEQLSATGRGDIPITDYEIKKKINSYKEQDRKAGRKICGISVEQIISLLLIPFCYHCQNLLAYTFWTLDRKDHTIGHSFENVVLSCVHCNVKRKIKSQRIFFWDSETYPDRSNDFGHCIYNIGVCEDASGRTPTGILNGKSLYDNTKIFYGKNSQDRFERFLMELSQSVEKKVESELNTWIKQNRSKYELKKFSSAIRKQRTILLNAHKCVFYSFNGAKFDNQFIFKSKNLIFNKYIDSYGVMYMTLEGDYIEFKDVIRMTGQTSLEKLCKDFKLDEEFMKTHFPHKFASEKNLDYVGDVPTEEYWEEGTIPDEHVNISVKDIVRLKNSSSSSEHFEVIRKENNIIYLSNGTSVKDEELVKIFDFKKTSIHYQKLDVVSLCIIWDKLSKAIHDTTGLDTADFISAPSLAYTYILKCTPQGSVSICTNRAVDAFIREAIQGGRCFPQKIKFESTSAVEILKQIKEDENILNEEYIFTGMNYKKEYIIKSVRKRDNLNDLEMENKIKRHLEKQKSIRELYNVCSDYLEDFDAVSLYASAMANFDYPTGMPYWVSEKELNSIKDSLNNCDKGLRLGIVECIITFKEADKVICPLLSHHSKDGRLLYTVNEQTTIKTTIDIMEAVKHNGATVTKVIKAILWQKKAPIFRKGITRLFNMRKKAKDEDNDALSQAVKLLLCSSYGKMGQKIIDFITKIESNNSEIEKFYHKGVVLLDRTMCNGKQCLLYLNKQRPSKVDKPVHLNAFILAYSKVIMNDCIEGFGGFVDWNKTFYYTDTDSIHIHHDEVKELQKNKNDIIGKNMGQLHDDIEEVNDGKIIKAYFLAPKLYLDVIIGFIKDIDKEIGYSDAKKNGDRKLMAELDSKRELTVVYHIRAKGVQKSSRKPLELENLKSALHELGLPENISQAIFDKYMENQIREKITKEDITKVIGSEISDNEYRRLLNICLPIHEIAMDMDDFDEMYEGKSVSFVGRRFEKAQKDPKKTAIKTIYAPKIINKKPWNGRKLDKKTGRWLPLKEKINLKNYHF